MMRAAILAALLAGCASVPPIGCMKVPPPPINLLAVPAPLPPVPADLPRPR